MYYIEETDDELIKYEVEINEENLIELREKIINNCSNIIHHRLNKSLTVMKFEFSIMNI